MTSTLSALLFSFFGLRRANAYRPERYYMRGPGPKSRAGVAR